MTLENISVRDMSTLKWAVRVLRLEARRGNARSQFYTTEEVLDECNSLDERLSAVLAAYYAEQVKQ